MQNNRRFRIRAGMAVGAAAVAAAHWAGATATGRDARASAPDPIPLAPLSTVAIPHPTGGDIANQAAAVRLGKAFFWDIQMGSDGQTACATCHFHAGADDRRANSMHPGPNGVFDGGSSSAQSWNGQNLASDDRVGSQGIVRGLFTGLAGSSASAVDTCTPAPAPPFGTARQVTARNAPSIIGAVLYVQGFWDGRANEHFNGVDPFGATGNATGRETDIDNASLASQAVGPPGSDVEAACSGRALSGPGSLGTKLLARQPLQHQMVDPSDSVLGALSGAPANGLVCEGRPCTYATLIAEAFGDTLAVEAEGRFARVWGQAIQAYEATLVPDQTPLDRYLAGDAAALSPSEKEGLELFRGKAECNHCHAGPELTDASYTVAAARGPLNEDGGDQGFHNVGVRPVAEDPGRAGLGPKGVSFSQSGSPKDRGAFKTPSLRNVKLTAPYFHNGGKSTLFDVVQFYGAGVDFPNGPELASHVQADLFTRAEASPLLAFLTNALTDCRVEKERAPFDHPSLPLPGAAPRPAVGAGGNGPCP